MKSNELVMMAAVGVAAVVLLNRAKAATAPAGTKSAAVPATSIRGDLWSAVLGGGWKAITDAQNADGSQAFLMKNFLGQVVTSDGKPVGREYAEMFPATYGLPLPVDLSFGGVQNEDYLSSIGLGMNY